MNIELVAYSQENSALDPADLLEMSDLATIWNGASTYPENVIEYAGRVCYRSTHRMGTAPRFIINRVKEGHEDIIEHIVATVRVRNSEEPLRWRMLNGTARLRRKLTAVGWSAPTPASGWTCSVAGSDCKRCRFCN